MDDNFFFDLLGPTNATNAKQVKPAAGGTATSQAPAVSESPGPAEGTHGGASVDGKLSNSDGAKIAGAGQLSVKELQVAFEDVIKNSVQEAVDISLSKFAKSLRTVLESVSRRIDAQGTLYTELRQTVLALKDQYEDQTGNMQARFTAIDIALRDIDRGVQSLRDKQELAEAQAMLAKLAGNEKQDSAKHASADQAGAPEVDEQSGHARVAPQQSVAAAVPVLAKPGAAAPGPHASSGTQLQNAAQVSPIPPAGQHQYSPGGQAMLPPQALVQSPPGHPVSAPQQLEQYAGQAQPQAQPQYQSQQVNLQPAQVGAPGGPGQNNFSYSAPSIPQQAPQQMPQPAYSAPQQPAQQAPGIISQNAGPPHFQPPQYQPGPVGPMQPNVTQHVSSGPSYPGPNTQSGPAYPPSAQQTGPSYPAASSGPVYPSPAATSGPSYPAPAQSSGPNYPAPSYAAYPQAPVPSPVSPGAYRNVPPGLSAARQNSMGQPTEQTRTSARPVPLDMVVNDIQNMGFERSQIMAVINQLQRSGQAVDLNVIIDRLTNGRY